MFSFQWPWFALLLPLPFIIKLFWSNTSADTDTAAQFENMLLHPAISKLEQAFQPSVTALISSELIKTILLTILWSSLVLTLMRPQWLQDFTQIKNRGYDLMLAVDVSRSMLALDFSVDGKRVNRLAVVKGVVKKFVEQRQGDRIGLILFGDGAYVQSPLTTDGNAVGKMLDNAVPRVAGDGTAIGDAIGLAVKKLRDQPPGSRILILLTDGENTSGSLAPLEAAQLAKQYDIRIYTIGVGSKGNVPFPDKNGRITMEKMEIDEKLLTEIANRTNGEYFRATETKVLEEIYQRIDKFEKTEAVTRTVAVPESLHRWPLAITIFTLLMLFGLSLGRGGRWA